MRETYQDRIRELREDKALTQQQLGAAIGVSQRLYSNYETGTRRLSVEALNKLADFHGVSTDYILCRTNVKTPPPR